MKAGPKVVMTKEEFRAIRNELGVTQQQLANMLGLRWQSSVNTIEAKTGPSGVVAAHLLTLLKIHRKKVKENA